MYIHIYMSQPERYLVKERTAKSACDKRPKFKATWKYRERATYIYIYIYIYMYTCIVMCIYTYT